MKLLESAYDMNGQCNVGMIPSHLIWNVTLGFAESELSRRGNQLFDGKSKNIGI